MEISHTAQDHSLILSIRGDIDALTADSLTNEIEARMAEGHTNLVVDFGAVHYVSSMGVRSLMNAVKETRSRGGDFVLANVQESIRRLLKLSGLTTIVKVYADVDAAAATFAQKPT